MGQITMTDRFQSREGVTRFRRLGDPPSRHFATAETPVRQAAWINRPLHCPPRARPTRPTTRTRAMTWTFRGAEGNRTPDPFHAMAQRHSHEMYLHLSEKARMARVASEAVNRGVESAVIHFQACDLQGARAAVDLRAIGWRHWPLWHECPRSNDLSARRGIDQSFGVARV